MANRTMGSCRINPMHLVLIAGLVVCAIASGSPARAQTMREFQPIARGEIYDEAFLEDFWTSLGSRPADLTWVEQSETVRLLVTAGSQAVRGDAEAALRTLDLIPSPIIQSFPFLTMMREDLLAPSVLEPWYADAQARTMLLSFYKDTWLAHPEYRDDFQTFEDDTKGRASRVDNTVPAVWILANLPSYGFVPDRNLTEDDPYLFLWDLLTSVTFFAQRSTYYGVPYDNYEANAYKAAVVAKAGQTIKAAHETAAREEMSRGFWGELITTFNPFEAPAESTPATGQQAPPVETGPTSHETPQSEQTPAQPSTTTASEASESEYSDLFRPPGEAAQGPSLDEQFRRTELERRILDLESRVSTRAAEEPVVETPPAEEPVIETPPVEETPVEETPNEFEPTTPPSETEPEQPPSGELGNYAISRLGEISEELKDRINTLARDLGQETIDLVILYNDRNVSQDTITAAENRYIAKREAFLAGLAVWDRFNMEVYSPLTLADFNDLIMVNLRAPYDVLKSSNTQWAQYQNFEDKFEQAFSQIETGTRGRREDPDVVASEEAALTTYLPDYNDMVKEIEDLLSGISTGSG